MPKFAFGPLATSTEVITSRLGAGTGPANFLTDAERGKFVKLAGPSRYDLAAIGDDIEGWIVGVETAPMDNYTVGSVGTETEFLTVTADGLQATPGVGNLAVRDYVLVGTPLAKGTTLGTLGAPRVVKATDQAAAKSSPFAYRVADLGSAGTGAPGTQIVIQAAC